jgi:hypothetical protein
MADLGEHELSAHIKTLKLLQQWVKVFPLGCVSSNGSNAEVPVNGDNGVTRCISDRDILERSGQRWADVAC